MSASRARGTRAETAVVNWLRDHGWPHAERRALHGANDKGDITGLGPVVIEVKDCAKPDLAGWLDETETERRNANADIGVVVRRRRGRPNPGQWFALLPLEQLARLLREAGY